MKNILVSKEKWEALKRFAENHVAIGSIVDRRRYASAQKCLAMPDFVESKEDAETIMDAIDSDHMRNAFARIHAEQQAQAAINALKIKGDSHVYL